MAKFDKKYNSSDKENEIRTFWEENKIFKFDKDSSKPIFSIDTPPPTISGKMHIGHAFSYTQQDFVARYRRMVGDEIYFPFGTDDNGLPTEKLVQKEKKVNLRKVDRSEATKIVLDYLKDARPKFIADWKNLGMSCDFDLSYSTIDDFSRKISQESFLELVEKGLIERRKGPVMWDRVFQTAIAQAELEDLTRKGFLNYVKAPVVGTDKTFMIYATTRPELCFAVVGISVEEKGKYVKIKVGDEFWITGKETLEEKFCDIEYSIVEEITGSNLIGEKVNIPVVNREITISHDASVLANFGTGIAYFCSYGGQEDIEWVKRHRVEPIALLEKDGRLGKLGKEYEGMLCDEARKKIITDMENDSHIFKKELKEQVLNVGERSGVEVEFIISNQWYVNYLDKKEYFFEMAQKFNWTPEHMRVRIENWIKGLNWDWGFSRQRHFGVPIPVWYGKESGKKYYAHKSQLPIDPTLEKPKLMKKIYFVRHGEYGNNVLKKMNFDFSKKISLTKNGISQARELGKDLAGVKFDRVITSNFTRCQETAKNICKYMSYNVLQNSKNFQEDSRLNEMKIGEDTASYSEHRKRVNSQILENKVLDDDVSIKENLEVLKIFFNELKESKDENILVVAHKDILRLIKIINETSQTKKVSDGLGIISKKNSLNKDLKTFYDYNPKNCESYLAEFEIEIKEELVAETDVFDTWFTSASSSVIASKLLGEDVFKRVFPMTLRPQAHDIINFWLFYSMAKTNLLYKKNPFRDVNISGFVLAPNGTKMSKSKGNGIDPQKVVEKYSNDSMRFAAASTKLGQDIPYQEKTVQTGLKLVNKIFNATKFADMLLENLEKGDEKIDNFNDLKSIDKWILAKLQDIIKSSTKSFDKYDYAKAKSDFEGFFMRDIADNYLEIVKERLWKPEVVGLEQTIKAQRALYYSLYNSIKGLAPVVPFICEEVYLKFFSKYEEEKSIHLSSWPVVCEKFVDSNFVELGNKFVAIVGAVRKFKSENQVSMKTQITKLTIECDKNLEEFILDSILDLKSVTSSVNVVFDKAEIETSYDDIKVSIEILKE